MEDPTVPFFEYSVSKISWKLITYFLEAFSVVEYRTRDFQIFFWQFENDPFLDSGQFLGPNMAKWLHFWGFPNVIQEL